jgi:hypothetical protein
MDISQSMTPIRKSLSLEVVQWRSARQNNSRIVRRIQPTQQFQKIWHMDSHATFGRCFCCVQENPRAEIARGWGVEVDDCEVWVRRLFFPEAFSICVMTE